jgi:hypothetical protein
MDSWTTFVSDLRSNFGTIDPVGDAEEELDHLRMKENHHILRYNVDFNRLSALVQWGDPALCHCYYKGLAERIKDILSQQPKIKTLVLLREAAQIIDSRYWERNREKTRTEKAPGTSDKSSDNSKKSKNPSSDNHSGGSNSNSGGSNQSTKNKNQDNRKDNKSSTNSPPSTKKTDTHLGKDGKLTAEERKRRMDNSLCMFCGGAGHKASDCTKSGSSASKTKGKSSKTDAPTDSSSTSDSKK